MTVHKMVGKAQKTESFWLAGCMYRWSLKKKLTETHGGVCLVPMPVRCCQSWLAVSTQVPQHLQNGVFWCPE
ncbi:MAG: hypothetical protein ACO1OQ_11525, partial [Rufibacter sp.]